MLAGESRDLSQAEKKISVAKAEQIQIMTTTGTPPLTLFFETLKNRVVRGVI